LGSTAARAVVGRAVSTAGTRHGYAWLFGESEDKNEAAADAIPVFFLGSPNAAIHNKFAQANFEADLAWALTVDAETLRKPDLLAEVVVVEPGDAEIGFAKPTPHGAARIAFDFETGGRHRTPYFSAVSFAAAWRTAEGRATLAAATEGAGLSGEVAEWSAAVLADETPKTGANVQYDLNVADAVGWRVGGDVRDVRLRRKLYEAHASGALDDMADLVGMGGFKREAEEAMAAIVARTLYAVRHADKRDAKEQVELAKRAERERLGKKPLAIKAPKADEAQKIEACAEWRRLQANHPALAAYIAAHPSGVEAGGWKYALLAVYDPDLCTRYNASDVLATLALDEYLDEIVRADERLRRVCATIVDKLPRVVAQIERWGMRVDYDALEVFDSYLVAQLEPILAKLANYPSVKNWNSAEQKAALLYDELGLKPPKLTKGKAPSVDADSLKALRGQHPVVDLLLEYARYTDLRKTFARGADGSGGMLPAIRNDGRIHPSILMDGTETGRPSCHEPNLFNIPAKKYPIEGKLARGMFAAPPGCVMLSFDFSQIELRIAAHLSRDEKMIEIFTAGHDYHLRTAQLIAPHVWRIPADEATDEHRSHAKNFVFGLLYGMGDRAMAARMFGTQSPSEEQIAAAAQIRAAIMGEFTGLAQWISAVQKFARDNGYVHTYIDGLKARRRLVHDSGDKDSMRRAFGDRAAVNTPVQGTAADYLNRSMIVAVEAIAQLGWEDRLKMVLPLYDQLLFESHESVVDAACETMPELMTAWPCRVPIVADAEIGPSWGHLRKLRRTRDGLWECFAKSEKDANGKKSDVFSPPNYSALAAYKAALEISG
jgi:DNA polymerase I-like protein with 3'-5' exonuclease and polymerase domains